jgi:hypothetical protein
MAAMICPMCAVPLNVRRVASAEFEQCPDCGGAWVEKSPFEALWSQRGMATPKGGGRYLSRGFDWPSAVIRKMTFIKIAVIGLFVIGVIAAFAGYFVVRPLWNYATVTGKNLITTGAQVNTQQLRERANALLDKRSKALVDQAAGVVENAAQSVRKEVNSPASSPQTQKPNTRKNTQSPNEGSW